MKLLVVGSVAFDAIETPFGKTDKILGGAATYIGITSSVLGVKSGIVSVVGGDFPQEHLDMFTNRNVNIEGIEIVKDGKTFCNGLFIFQHKTKAGFSGTGGRLYQERYEASAGHI